jgi:hypothetical protein
MSCKQAYFNGWGSCAALMEKMNGASLNKKSESVGLWTDTTALQATAWRAKISGDVTGDEPAVMLPIMSFENTTDDLEIVTSQLGKKSAPSKPIPSGMIALDASLCDYKTLHALEDIWFEFVPFFQDGTYWLTRRTDGNMKGFRCRISTKAGLPPEDKTLSYPMYLFFNSYKEFENVVVIQPDFNFKDLFDYSPIGLDIRITTAYNTGTGVVILDVTKRCTGVGHTGLVLADFAVVESNATATVSATAITEHGLGSYSLTIQEGGSTALDSGEYAVINAHEDDGTYLTYLSHSLKVNA